MIICMNGQKKAFYAMLPLVLNFFCLKRVHFDGVIWAALFFSVLVHEP
jgi:hypothetical protein